jgi:hypothetical protein
MFACCAEEDEMERQDACVKMGFQDAIELLPVEMLSKIVPPTRTFIAAPDIKDDAHRRRKR